MQVRKMKQSTEITYVSCSAKFYAQRTEVHLANEYFGKLLWLCDFLKIMSFLYDLHCDVHIQRRRIRQVPQPCSLWEQGRRLSIRLSHHRPTQIDLTKSNLVDGLHIGNPRYQYLR